MSCSTMVREPLAALTTQQAQGTSPRGCQATCVTSTPRRRKSATMKLGAHAGSGGRRGAAGLRAPGTASPLPPAAPWKRGLRAPITAGLSAWDFSASWAGTVTHRARGQRGLSDTALRTPSAGFPSHSRPHDHAEG